MKLETGKKYTINPKYKELRRKTRIIEATIRDWNMRILTAETREEEEEAYRQLDIYKELLRNNIIEKNATEPWIA